MGISDTSPRGGSLETEPRGRSGAGEARGAGGAPSPHLRGIIWLIRLPLVYSASRHYDNER